MEYGVVEEAHQDTSAPYIYVVGIAQKPLNAARRIAIYNSQFSLKKAQNFGIDDDWDSKERRRERLPIETSIL